MDLSKIKDPSMWRSTRDCDFEEPVPNYVTRYLKADLDYLPDCVKDDMWRRKPDLPDPDEEKHDPNYILPHAGVPNAEWWNLPQTERDKYRVKGDPRLKKEVQKKRMKNKAKYSKKVGDATDRRNDKEYADWCSKRDKPYRNLSDKGEVRRPHGRAGPYMLWDRKRAQQHKEGIDNVLNYQQERIDYRNADYPLHSLGQDLFPLYSGYKRPYHPQNPLMKTYGISYPEHPEFDKKHKDYYKYIRYDVYNAEVEKRVKKKENPPPPPTPPDMDKGALNEEEYDRWKLLFMGYKEKNFDKNYVYMKCPHFVKLLNENWDSREAFIDQCEEMKKSIPNFSNPDFLLTMKFEVEYWNLEFKRKPSSETMKKIEESIAWVNNNAITTTH